MVEILKVLLISFVEGFTEFLPISSTGHIIIIEHFIKLSNNTQFVNSFTIIIQLGAILAVIREFFKELNPISKIDRKNKISLWINIIIASIPAGILGILFKDLLEKYLMTPKVVCITLIFYGILILIVERYLKTTEYKVSDINNISRKDSLIVGLCQTLALVPGTSRSLTTIVSGLLLGFSRDVATKFSFFLAIPIIGGASLLKILKMKVLNLHEMLLIALGFILSYLFSKVFISLLLQYVKKHNFNIFGIYRIILALIILVML